MQDCWLDTYGNVYWVETLGGHNDVAQEILRDEFPMENDTTPMRTGPLAVDTWESRGFYMSFSETLERRGWLRFSTTINRWSCEHILEFESRYPRPTQAQIDKMYELTGFNYYDPESYSRI